MPCACCDRTQGPTGDRTRGRTPNRVWASLIPCQDLRAQERASARHAADQDDERPALLEEAGHHLVALHIGVVVAAQSHHAKQDCFQVVLCGRRVRRAAGLS